MVLCLWYYSLIKKGGRTISGGHFGDYDYYKVNQFADELADEIRHNGTDGDHSNWYPDHSDEVIEYLKQQVPNLRKMAEIMRCCDYLYSGDYDDDSFMNVVKEVEEKYQ